MRLQLVLAPRSTRITKWIRDIQLRCGYTLALTTLAVPMVISSARADEASGTWTGEIEGRANYYWERSTRVFLVGPPGDPLVLPTVAAQVTAPNGLRVHANYLVDVITAIDTTPASQIAQLTLWAWVERQDARATAPRERRSTDLREGMAGRVRLDFVGFFKGLSLR